MSRETNLIVASIVLLGVAGFFWLGGRTGEPEPYSGPVDKISVANIGQFSIFNLVAKERGYFERYGLDATVDEYDAGASAMGALLSGKADFAIAADFVGVNAIFKNEELRILAIVSDHDVFRLIARKDKGIVAPGDLKGKRIGVTMKTAGEFYLGQFLTLNGLGLADVDRVDLAPAEMTAKFESGEIDAVLIFEPHAFGIGERMRNEVVVWSAQGEQRALGLAYATSSLIERRPDIVERYLRALVDAERYVRENGRETRAFVARTLLYDDAYVNAIWPKFKFEVKLDQYLLLAMETQARWTIDNGLTDRRMVPNYLEYIHFGALENVKPDAVTITH